jgi:hypothetical protein
LPFKRSPGQAQVSDDIERLINSFSSYDGSKAVAFATATATQAGFLDPNYYPVVLS